MAISVVMPALEMAQETGKLVAWRKKEGERVAKGEPLLEVETDKAVLEVEALADGILAGVTAEAGAEVQVGKTIAWILQPGESVPVEAKTDATSARATTPAATHTEVSPRLELAATGSVRVSPKARRLAQERGIDLAQVSGTGPDGVITTDDVLAAAQTASAPGASIAAPSSAARLMAERTAQSWTTVPHFFLAREVDATSLVVAREVFAKDGKRPSLTDILVRGVAQTLRKHPRVNSSWIDGSVRSNADVNIAIAIAVEDAVVTGVVHQADTLSPAAIAIKRTALADHARTGRLTPADISGGTFTISNLGMYGVDSFQAIIVPPQAAILAVGRVTDRVVASDGEATVRPMITLTLSCDHRALDGATAAIFLKDLAENLQHCADPPPH
jgi:pyruvate dehydrogenase E2 component (dihydrolipoamide acetyltransferase)